MLQYRKGTIPSLYVDEPDLRSGIRDTLQEISVQVFSRLQRNAELERTSIDEARSVLLSAAETESLQATEALIKACIDSASEETLHDFLLHEHPQIETPSDPRLRIVGLDDFLCGDNPADSTVDFVIIASPNGGFNDAEIDGLAIEYIAGPKRQGWMPEPLVVSYDETDALTRGTRWTVFTMH